MARTKKGTKRFMWTLLGRKAEAIHIGFTVNGNYTVKIANSFTKDTKHLYPLINGRHIVLKDGFPKFKSNGEFQIINGVVTDKSYTGTGLGVRIQEIDRGRAWAILNSDKPNTCNINGAGSLLLFKKNENKDCTVVVGLYNGQAAIAIDFDSDDFVAIDAVKYTTKDRDNYCKSSAGGCINLNNSTFEEFGLEMMADYSLVKKKEGLFILELIENTCTWNRQAEGVTTVTGVAKLSTSSISSDENREARMKKLKERV